ncbi:MAG: UvrD-helicase domain-containing protein [Bacilli bacterium]|nr:UvrD-helicase domain-containing protein [Bacilli bacterium]
MEWEKELNKDQYEAVSSTNQYNRVIAGAGSGKTRVLTYRIAYLIDEFQVKPWNILAITFTNKVAAEMRTRVCKLLPYVEHDLTIKTFHSFAAYFLRIEISAINFPTSFTIFDEEDQLSLIKDIGSQLGYKKSDPLIKKAVNYISGKKLRSLYPDDITIKNEFFEGERDCLEIYTRYEEEKNKMYALDFDDLLLKTNQILTDFPDIRAKWQRKIQHILIDEFQDTNDVEYKLVKLLSSPATSLYVVGDPDQTIYTWRGANQDIILNLDRDFKGIVTTILDRNYRSTQTILNSANKLIGHNKFRVPKNLYTENNKGESIVVKSSGSTNAEAEYVAREIYKLHTVNKIPYNDIVLLYRSNYVTVDFEAALMNHQIPYRIFGGQKFYQRTEIKDVLAYFRLISNPNDDVSFKRVYNVPKRGVGDSSYNVLVNEAKEANKSLYNYVLNVDIEDSNVPQKAMNALKRMVVVIEKTKADIDKNEETFSKILEDMLASFNYYDHLLKEDDGDDRIDNVKALFSQLRYYLKNNPESSFDEYLQNVALVSGQDELVDGEFVNLMTVHTAKGLEFPVVFIVRFNDGVFPSARSRDESGFKGLEEERRLAYVAMTRAKERLYLSCAGGYNYVIGGYLLPSQFYKESGNLIAQEVPDYNPFKSFSRSNNDHQFAFSDGPNASFTSDIPIKQDFSEKTNGITNWEVGDIVIHRKLGRGIVRALNGDDIIEVEFIEHGMKKILANHPSVTKGEK